MSSEPFRALLRARLLSARLVVAALAVAVAAGGATVWGSRTYFNGHQDESAISSQSKRPRGVYYPTSAEWAALTVESPQLKMQGTQRLTEGKIAVDEDRSTPIFSPYAGRVTKLFAKPGDVVSAGQLLFTVEATDMVQAQNDFIAGLSALSKARAALELSQINDKRQRLLFEGKAVPLKEVQQARASLDTAENDVRSAEVALEAARNKLRLLGKTDDEIAAFQDKGIIDPSTPIHAPIGGTIVARKVGPGQYVGSGANDPVFVIGDLSTVWLLAFVRETEVPRVQIGQSVSFTLLAQPNRRYPAQIAFVGSGLDPTTRRLLVRASVDNALGNLKPEMYANVDIELPNGDVVLAVPQDSIIVDGSGSRIWVVREDRAIELRRIKLGSATGGMVEVKEGLSANERVVTKAAVLNDRIAGI